MAVQWGLLEIVAKPTQPPREGTFAPVKGVFTPVKLPTVSNHSGQVASLSTERCLSALQRSHREERVPDPLRTH